MFNYNNLGIRELWKKLNNEIIFFKLPAYILYNDIEDAGLTPSIPLFNGKVDEQRLKDLRTVGRPVIEIARFAIGGTRLYMDDRNEVVKLVKMLYAYMEMNDRTIRLANYRDIPKEDIEAIEFLGESILTRHMSRVNAMEIKMDNEIKSLFAPSLKQTKGKRPKRKAVMREK